MTIALRRYPRRIEGYRYARNGFVPEAPMARRLINGQNHILAFRRKTVLTANETPPPAGSTGAIYYTHWHSGYGATHLGYIVGTMLDSTSTGTDPTVAIRSTLSGGATTTATIHAGNFSGTPTDCPDTITWHRGRIAVDANSDYEVDVSTNDYARLQSLCLYEIGSDVVDDTIDYYIEDSPTIEFPIYDSIRQKHAEGLSNMWKANAGHIMGWYGPGHAAAPTFNSTTWTNVIDGATSVTANTAGYYLGDGDETLQAWRRYSSVSLEVKIAVRCSVTNSATGEVRLENSSGTVLSITGMGTSAGWYTATGNLADLDTLAKCDLQCRTSNGANTVTLYAVVLYPYVA